MDHQAKALSRIYWQYQNSAKLKAWLSMLPRLANEKIEAPLSDILGILDIDNATGHQLDVAGRIAGISRPRINATELKIFGYNQTPDVQPYNMAPYAFPGFSYESMPMPDRLFRVFVKSKIAKNNSMATIDDVKVSTDAIFGQSSRVVDYQDMTFGVYLIEEPSPDILYIIRNYDLIPRPQGVRIRHISVGWPAFGYQGTLDIYPYDVAAYTELV